MDLLKNEDNLVVDNQLNKNKIIEAALKVEPFLISLLIKSDTFKKHFFKEVENVLVFDKIKFQRFVNNKSFLPDSYTAFKNKIGLAVNDDTTDNFIKTKNDVVLVWPHKDCVLEGGQTKEDQKRNEIFWNETLAPDSVDRLLDAKAFTNFKKYDKDGEHKVTEFRGDENLILKGNNLLVLSSLLKTHRGKIKLIYIDPPYNTGSDSFQYNDNFNHATWLTFMKNRLVLAKKLLKKEGLIFIHLDDIEHAYLKVLCDEIFGQDRFVNSIAVRSSTASGMKTAHREKTIIKQKDYILVYKNDDNIKFKAQYTKKNEWDTHYNQFLDRDNLKIYSLKDILIEKGLLLTKQKLSDIDINDKNFIKFYIKHKNSIFQTAPELPIEIKKESRLKKDIVIKYGSEDDLNFAINGRRMTFISKTLKPVYDNQIIREGLATLLCDFWNDIDFQNTQNEGGVSFPGGKKPEVLIQRIIDMTTNEGDIVLDYHLGSGTTAAVAHKMNRKYIGIEQMNYGENNSIQRLKNVISGEQSGISKAYNWKGGGSFKYAELMQYNQYFINKIQESKTKEVVLDLWGEMQDKAFISYQFNKDIFNKNLEAFKTASLEIMQHYLIEVLDKNQLYVNFTEIEDENFSISAEDKILNYSFYNKK